MKTVKILFAILMIGTVLSSCGKYEDGPKISLASKKSRLVNEWKLVAEYYNGVQQNTTSTEIWDVKKDGTYTDTYGSSSSTGTWAFSSDKESVTVTENGSSNATTFKILRLKSKELWLEYTFTVYSYTTTLEWHYESN